jgi:hypothetical protein
MTKIEIEIVEENGEAVAIYVVMDGIRIAKRGTPETPQARQWVSIEPGWVVRDGKGGVRSGRMAIEYHGTRMQ